MHLINSGRREKQKIGRGIKRDIERALYILPLFTLFISLFVLIPHAYGIPVGATVTYISNSTMNATPSSGTYPTGRIIVLNLNGLQQDYQWKAFVGNVTGKLTLDDASGNTIYDWTLATVSGEVYTSRYSSVDWSTIACATTAVINNEETALGITSSDVDSISNTFTGSSSTIQIGTVQVTGCPSTKTYNSTGQPSNDYEEFLLKDGNNYLIYGTIISDNANGFDNSTYDFQMIVADNETSTTGSTYYFWVELG